VTTAAVVLAAIGLAVLSTACLASLGHRQSGPFVAPPRTPSVLPTPEPAAAPADTAPPAETPRDPAPARPPSTPSVASAPAPRHAPASASAARPPESLDELAIRIRVTDDGGTRVVTLPLDDYVRGCVRAELSSHAIPEGAIGTVLQVQAVVSRTYAIANLGRHRAEGFDLCDGTHCQLFRSATAADTESDAATRAVAATHGQVVIFDGRAIQAVFHSNCGGHTTSSDRVWSGPAVPYLRPVPDWFCARSGGAKWSFTANEQQLRRALNADNRTIVGGRLDRVEIAERDEAGRATKVAVFGARNSVVTAEQFRAVMRQAFGARSLQSTWFSVTHKANLFVFDGVGYGHGVGLCQAGAGLRALAGQSPSAILAHYYPGTSVAPLSAAAASVRLRRANGNE
jgi:SpoIID/LytB domain protein